MNIEIVDFWFGLSMLAVIACLLIYGLFETRFEMARRKGSDALALLRRNARRLRVLIAGTAVILTGILISPLPGPGLSVLGPLGLAILASEFVWAQRLAHQIKERSGPLREATQRVANRTPRWVVIPVCVAYWGATIPIELWTSVPSMALWPAASILFVPIFLWASLVLRPAAR
ncbi:MAG: PGPGW domain-containing protein [Planctomycetota bacterium]|nr:PGPGW domain-containing protein [Planctomycetota bacterium]